MKSLSWLRSQRIKVSASFAFRVASFEIREKKQPATRNPLLATQSTELAARGLTLIELLVVIVILTTLVAGVIPVLSPNNDVRKLREAGRGLQSYITLAQARAARTGRPQGIAFRESAPGSGVALEVFGLEVPPPFAGFSTESRCELRQIDLSVISYGNTNPVGGASNGGTKFLQYNGFPLFELSFVLADGSDDVYPPRMFQIGDFIDVRGNKFLIVDDGNNSARPNATRPYPDVLPAPDPDTRVRYLEPTYSGSDLDPLQCVWINSSSQIPPQGKQPYQIYRQASNSSESPYQLPAGIAIDMQGSVTEGAVTGGWPLGNSLCLNPTVPVTRTTNDVVGIMFSPTGAVSSVLFNGNELSNASRLVLLLGRVENGGLVDSGDPSTQAWAMANANDKNEIEKKQEEINWLNLDSRLLSIATRSGRATVSETAFVDLSSATFQTDAEEQIEAAHEFAHEMSTAK